MPAAVDDHDPRLPPYGTLLDRKRVIPSPRTGYVAIDRLLFLDLMAQRLADAVVDEAWYLATYPDVREAIAAGSLRSAAHHYARSGYFEHRMPRRIVVDEAWFLQANPDVKQAIDKRVYASAQEYYDLTGFREGRLPYPGFSLFEDRKPG